MMGIKSILPLHDLPEYSIEKELDAVQKKKKGPELSGESLVYMIEVCLCFGVAEWSIKKWRAYSCCSRGTIDLRPAPRVLFEVVEEMMIKDNEVTFYNVYTMRNGK
jgi:hypothetical protein